MLLDWAGQSAIAVPPRDWERVEELPKGRQLPLLGRDQRLWEPWWKGEQE